VKTEIIIGETLSPRTVRSRIALFVILDLILLATALVLGVMMNDIGNSDVINILAIFALVLFNQIYGVSIGRCKTGYGEVVYEERGEG
jgi:hypothetical protein